MSESFRLLYDVKDFPTRDDANADFDDHWRSDDPRGERWIKEGESIREACEGAHHKDGRRRLIRKLEVINYTKLQPDAATPGAENVLAKCPECEETGFYYRNQFPAPTSVYVHLASIQDGQRVEIARHALEIPQGGMTDHSDFTIKQ